MLWLKLLGRLALGPAVVLAGASALTLPLTSGVGKLLTAAALVMSLAVALASTALIKMRF